MPRISATQDFKGVISLSSVQREAVVHKQFLSIVLYFTSELGAGIEIVNEFKTRSRKDTNGVTSQSL